MITPIRRFCAILDQHTTNVEDGRRFAAYLIDWFLSALCMMLPMCLSWLYVTKEVETMRYVNVWTLQTLLGTKSALLIALAALACALFYEVIVPWKIYPGQTIGKRVMGYRMETKDGHTPGLMALLLRQGLGLFVLEGCLFNASALISNAISMVSGLNVTGIFLWASIVLTIISLIIALSSPSRRMLHDYLAKTHVVRTEETTK